MQLRPYQQDLFLRVRQAFVDGHRRVFMCLPTGTGKTVVFAHMARESKKRKKRIWICVPRRELLEQSSATLKALDVPHGRIAVGHEESEDALHLVSKDTLIRRYNRIRVKPNFIILDEAHLYFDQQKTIQERYPDAFVVGVSASPERLDGRGLSDLYDILIEGPNIRWMVEHSYLAPTRIYCPPIVGLETVKRRGTEYDEEELHEFLDRNKVYGSAVEHYERLAAGRIALVFTRSVKAAQVVAGKFVDRGHRFVAVHAKTPPKKRQEIIEDLRAGTLGGVVNCEIATYGLDVPRVEALICLRPTLSRALYTQMLGRGLRPYPGKTECIVLDHVGLVLEHDHPYNQEPWRFNGRRKRKRKQDPERICPKTGYDCIYCGAEDCPYSNTRGGIQQVVDCQLKEIVPPLKLDGQTDKERLSHALKEAKWAVKHGLYNGCRGGPVGRLLALHRQLGTKNRAIQVYWMLAGRDEVNMPLLQEIGCCEGFKSGWAWVVGQRIEAKLEKRRAG